jgi:hypothetical protein
MIKIVVLTFILFTLIFIQSGVCQPSQVDTTIKVATSISIDDIGSWAIAGVGLHAPFTGSVYSNWYAIIGHEIRKEYFCFPIEFQYWQWTDGNDKTSSFLFSVSAKLRYTIYPWRFYGQVGIGSGSNIGFFINWPYALGTELALSKHIGVTAQLRRGLNLGSVDGPFYILGVTIKE